MSEAYDVTKPLSIKAPMQTSEQIARHPCAQPEVPRQVQLNNEDRKDSPDCITCILHNSAVESGLT